MKIERIYIEKEIDEYGYEEIEHNFGSWGKEDSFTIQRATGYVLGDKLWNMDWADPDPEDEPELYAEWQAVKDKIDPSTGREILCRLPYHHFVGRDCYEYFHPLAGGERERIGDGWGDSRPEIVERYGAAVAPFHYALQDWIRAEEYEDGHFAYEQLRAVAELDTAGQDQYIETEWSYSFEDEDELTIKEYTEEKLEELRKILLDMGFSNRKIRKAMKEVESHDS